MATTTTRIKDIPTTATTAASDDYFLIDGATNGTRKYAHNADPSAHGGMLQAVRSSRLSFFANLSDCTVTNGTATQDHYTGTISLTRNGSDSGSYASIKIPTPGDARNHWPLFDLSGDSYLTRIDHGYYIGNDTTLRRWDAINSGSRDRIKLGRYQHVSKHVDMTAGSSALTYAALADFRAVEIRAYANAETTTVLNIHDVFFVRSLPPPGGMIIWFDDAYDTTYTVAFPIMRALGIVGNACVVTDSVGQPGWCTVEQLREMQAAGWTIGIHGKDISNPNQTEGNFRIARDWARTNGFTGCFHHVLVGGQYGGGILESSHKVFKTTRTVSSGNQLIWPCATPGFYYGGSIVKQDSLATIIARYAENQKTYGGVFSTVLHRICTPSVEDPDVTIEDFTAFMQYIHDNGIQTFSAEKVFDRPWEIKP